MTKKKSHAKKSKHHLRLEAGLRKFWHDYHESWVKFFPSPPGILLPVLMLSCSVVLFVLFYLVAHVFWFSSLDEDRIIIITPGSSGIRIAHQLERQEIITDRKVFRTAVTLGGLSGRLHAGEYYFEKDSTIAEILRKITRGEVYLRKFTAIEGQTVRQILENLEGNPYLTGSLAAMPQEGSLLPQTYYFTRGMTRQALIAEMQKAMEQALDKLWPMRLADLLIENKTQAVILASLVERETGVAHERGRIAAVFYNRLRQGWPLQTDPTLIYWESKYFGVLARPLRKSDLRRKHPYNSYLNLGLPPTAIANPGTAALSAVLHPPQSREFFFVADGTGGHAFAETLAVHNKNVRVWRKIEAKRKKQAQEKPDG